MKTEPVKDWEEKLKDILVMPTNVEYTFKQIRELFSSELKRKGKEIRKLKVKVNYSQDESLIMYDHAYNDALEDVLRIIE